MIYLCSASSSRASLLDEFGIEFEQKSIEFDEERIKTNSVREFVYLASKGKLEAARKKYGIDIPILTADSLIYLNDNEMLKKPNSIDEARRMLESQSGARVSIVSSVHLQSRHVLFADTSVAHYNFSEFKSEELKSYLDSGKWRGKTGGCMVEGFCKKYIQSSDGLESTARGLQVEILMPWIKFATTGVFGAI